MAKEDLSHWVRACEGKRVLVVGDLILDRYVYGDAERISPEAPVPVIRTVERKEAVGGSANVAACLTALGCRVSCCGVVGRDRHARTLIELLAVQSVDATGIIEVDNRPTTTKTRLVGLAQHRHRQQLLRLDEEDTTPLAEKVRSALIEAACKLVAQSDAVCIEDYNKGVITSELAAAVIAESKNKGVPVLVDPAAIPCFDRYRGADIITPNRNELSVAAGRRFASLEDTANGATELLKSLELDAVTATVDREGAILVQRDQAWKHFPTIPRSVYDNTGAGDAVLAMLAASVAAGSDLETAVQLANLAGGLEVERFGCVPITADEILAELRIEDRRRNGKLRSLDDLVAEIGLRRDRGETVAFTNGCYDILHAGHVDLLRKARQEASLLIVGLNTDDSVRSLGKGDDRPVNAFENRAAVLSALECVDYVVGFEEQTPEALIQQIRPDVLVKGADYSKEEVVGGAFVESIGGRVVRVPLVEGLSTSNLIDKVRNRSELSQPT